MKGLMNVAMGILLLATPLSVRAEYLIYLKGGHYIVADNCTFWARQGADKDGDAKDEFILVEDCTIGEPEGPIFWSTIDGKFGEIDANNVFAIYGGKGPKGIKPPRERMALEDYLITNRGESFVNAKTHKEQDATVYGVKRDDLAKLDRRGVTEIAPEGTAKTGPGEGLCPEEAPEFSVTGLDLSGDNLVGFVTNLSSAPWTPSFEIEVHAKPSLQLKLQAKRSFLGKFKVEDPNQLRPGEGNNVYAPILKPQLEQRAATQMLEPVDKLLVEYIKRAIDPEGDVRLCAKKLKQPPGQPVEKPPSPPPPPPKG